ncbi:MAG: hypothetical protein PHR96_03150 [Clostridia bacterium]|nr:hypothetical protein [Clostridia bacterium]
MEFVEAFLNVLAILGIIIVGGFLIFFLGDVLLSILEPKQSKSEKKQSISKKERSFSKENEKELKHIKSAQKIEEDTITEFVPDEEFAFNLDLKNEESFKEVDYNQALDEQRKLNLFNADKPMPRNSNDFNFKNSDFMQNFNGNNKKELDFMQNLNEENKKDSDLNNLFNDKDFNFADEFDFNFLDEKPEDVSKQNERLENDLPENDAVENVNKIITQTEMPRASSENQALSSRRDFFESLEKRDGFENYFKETDAEPVGKPVDIMPIEDVNQNHEPEIQPEPVVKFKKLVEVQSEIPVVPLREPENNRIDTYNYIEIERTDNIDAGSLNFETINEAKLIEEIKYLKQELHAQKLEYDKLKQEFELNDSKLKTELTELEKLYDEAEKQEIKTAPLLTIEEYESRIEVLKTRLKENEKELKANKREFLPLRKVRKNLDNDKKKLRRREALVAKQKVMLYGVNNISEIDEEKAKKLAEDLDLLDGLKISVQHCEEVMENNKERYPILETTYRILTTVNKDLKDDVAECEANIRKLKGEDSSDDNGDDNGIINESKAVLSGNKEEAPKPKKKSEKKKKSSVPDAEETKFDASEVLVEDANLSNSTEEIQSIDNEINVTLSEDDMAGQNDFVLKDISEKDIFDLENNFKKDAFGIENVENNTVKKDQKPIED